MNKNYFVLLSAAVLGFSLAIKSARAAEGAGACTFDQAVGPICNTLDSAPADQPVKIGEAQFPSKKALEEQVADFEARKKAVADGKAKSVLTKAETERFNRLLERTKLAAAKAIIGPDRIESELTDEEKNMLSRIRGVQLSDLKSADETRGCETLGYWTIDYSLDKISLCPIMASYSDRSLIQALGIAVGHAVGECATVLPYEPKAGLKYKPIKAEKNPLDLKCEIGRCSAGAGLKSCLLVSRGINSKPGFSFENDDAKEHLALSVNYYRSPLQKQNPKISDTEVEKFAKSDIESNAKKWPACFPAETQYQGASATSDWLSSQIVVEDAKLNPTESGSVSLADSAGYLVDDACRLRKIRAIDKRFGHPKHEVRFNDVMFKNAAFRNLVGCKRAEGAAQDCIISHPKMNGSTLPGAPASSGEVLK